MWLPTVPASIEGMTCRPWAYNPPPRHLLVNQGSLKDAIVPFCGGCTGGGAHSKEGSDHEPPLRLWRHPIAQPLEHDHPKNGLGRRSRGGN